MKTSQCETPWPFFCEPIHGLSSVVHVWICTVPTPHMADGKVHFHVVCVAKSRAFAVQRLRLFVVAGAAPGRRRTKNTLFLVEAATKSQFSV